VRDVGDAVDAAGSSGSTAGGARPPPICDFLSRRNTIEVEPDDVPHLADKRRVCGQLRASRPGFATEPARSPLELLILPVTDGRLAASSAGAGTICARRTGLCVEWTRLMRPTRRAPPSLTGGFAIEVDRSLP